MSYYSFFSGILIGLLLLGGILSLILAVRGVERRINVPHFIFTVFIGASMAHLVFFTYSHDVTSMVRHDMLVNSFLLVAATSYLYLVVGLTGYRSRVLLHGLTALFAVSLLLNWLLPYGLTWESVNGIKEVRMIWGEHMHALDARTGPGNILVMVLIVAVLAFSIRAIVYQLQHGEGRYAVLLLLTIVIALSGILIDVILIEMDYAVLGIVDDIGIVAFLFLIGYRNSHHLLRSNDLLRESEERFQLLTDAAFEGVAFSEQGVIIDVNTQLADMLGYAVQEMIGRKTLDFVAPISREQVREQMRESNEPMYEHFALRKDGTAFPVEVRVKHMHLEGRGVRVTVIRDITERRRAEEQNLLLAQTIKSVRDCISITDSEDRIIYVNDAFLQTYGYTEAEVMGQHVSLLRPTDLSPEKTQGIFPSTREGGWHGEVLNRRSDGTQFPVELWTSVVRDQDGTPIAYVGVARDISDRKNASRTRSSPTSRTRCARR